MNQLYAKLLTIGELFDDQDAIYTVPIYQRNYAWQAEQIEQLLRDIQDAIHDQKDSYFLGNLMVTELQGAHTYFEVIDGQQRLTTLYLFLAFLAERRVTTKGPPGCLRYESRPRATEALRRVSTESSRDSVSLVRSSSTEDTGIHQGYNIIRQFMDQHINDCDKQRQFADFLQTKVTVVRASLPPKTDFNRYFEVMNTRGQQLQQVDIVKARLMQHLDNDAQRACFAWIWDACSDMDSYVQMSLTRGKSGLRTKIFGEDWSWLMVESFEQLVAIHTPDVAPVLPNMTIDEALAKYEKMGAREDSEDRDIVRFRSTIEFPALLLHVLKVIDNDGEENEGRLDDKGLIQRFAEFLNNRASETSCRVQEFGFKLLRCRNLFDSFVLKRQYSDEGDWSLQRLIKRGSEGQPTSGYKNTFSRDRDDVEEDGDVDSTTNDLLVLQSMLRVTYTSPRTMHWITILLKLLVESKPNKVLESDLAAVLREYARGKVRDSFPKNNQPSGFSINRIVFTYLDYLLWTDQQNPEFRFSFRNSIEHFYPQHPDEQQYGEKVSDENIHLMGNLALVSVGANSKFSNSLPRVKAENFKTTIEIQSPKLQMMAEIAREKQKWSDEEVLAHHKEIIDRLSLDRAIGQ